MIIKALSEIDSSSEVIDEIKEIFYSNSSVQSFKSEETKVAFYQKWLGLYIDNFSENFLLAFEDTKVLGYLCYCEDTFSFIEKFGALGGQARFKEEIKQFPAHLHMNSKVTGKGIGKMLLMEFEARKSDDLAGVHIITSPNMGNVKFYEKMEFSFQKTFPLNPQTTLLLMGKSFKIK